jgi:hypothetical protein
LIQFLRLSSIPDRTMHTSTTYTRAALAIAMASATATLIACGGRSSDPAAPTPTPDPIQPPAAIAVPQGIWQSATGALTTTSVLVTENGQVWGVFSNAAGTRLLKGQVANTGTAFTGQGKSYILGSTVTDNATVSVTTVPKTSLSGSVTGSVNNGSQTESFSLVYQSRYETPVTLASFTGNAWGATLGAGTITWRIDANGALTGTRTTGCTYTGQLSLRTEEKAVADVAITESCPAVTQMSGVAVKTSDNAGITMLLTTTGDAQGVLVGLR